MSPVPQKIKMTVEFEAVPIPTMYEMPADEYREFVSADSLVYVDHHDVLRSSLAGYPLATTLEQLDILIAHLRTLRPKMVPRSR